MAGLFGHHLRLGAQALAFVELCFMAYALGIEGTAYGLEKDPTEQRGKQQEVRCLEQKIGESRRQGAYPPDTKGFAKSRTRAMTRQKIAVDSTMASATN